MTFLLVLIIAVSLSMDAFSLSLAYGTLNLSKKDITKLALVVGIYHFFMPLIGMFLGNYIISFLPVNTDFIVFAILSIIGVQMIIETFREEKKVETMNFVQLLTFGLAVSIDSFSVGIGLKMIDSNFILTSLTFSLSSFIFTWLGLLLGKKINLLIGKVSTTLGGIVLIIIGFIYLF